MPENDINPHDMVNMHSAGQKLGLVKVPTALFDRWMEHGPGADLGVLEFRGKGNITLRLPKAEEAATDVPPTSGRALVMEEYAFVKNEMKPEERRSKGTMSVMSEGKDGTGFAIEGLVNVRADIRPKNIRNMYARKVAPKREIIMMGAREGTNATTHINKPMSQTQRENLKAQKLRSKRERMDKNDLKKKIFAMFGSHEFINTTDLIKHTDQPKTFLKDTLEEICVQITQGRLRHHWRLKDEYRTQMPASEAAASSTSA